MPFLPDFFQINKSRRTCYLTRTGGSRQFTRSVGSQICMIWVNRSSAGTFLNPFGFCIGKRGNSRDFLVRDAERKVVAPTKSLVNLNRVHHSRLPLLGQNQAKIVGNPSSLHNNHRGMNYASYEKTLRREGQGATRDQGILQP